MATSVEKPVKSLRTKPLKSPVGKIEKTILEKARAQGASLAGIATVQELKIAPSYAAYDKNSFNVEYSGVKWHEEHKSILVWALVHPESEPILDWWSMKVPGFSPGNRIMRAQSKKIRIWLGEELGINALSLPYQIEYGGAFLKDAAALAGLGIIGMNNLLVTPEYGPRVRLRGIFLEAELEPTGPIDFDPCSGCPLQCHDSYPNNAFRTGSFTRAFCKEIQDGRDANFEILEGSIMGIDEPSGVVKYCRKCELACPVGQSVIH